MENKFIIKKIIVTGKDTDGSILESYWIVEIKNQLIQAECFYFEQHRGMKNTPLMLGKNGKAEISLVFNNSLKLKYDKEKSFKKIAGNSYILEGEVIKLEKREKDLEGKLIRWNQAIIDCGFIFETSTKQNLKIGDYVVCRDNLILKNIKLDNLPERTAQDNNAEHKDDTKQENKEYSNKKELTVNLKIISAKGIEDTKVTLWDKGNLSIKIKSKEYSVPFNRNYYQTLRDLDRRVNKERYKILCNGTSKHVFCAGFCLNMAQGERVYYKNPSTGKLEVKDTFAYEEWNEYATQEEQEELLTK